METKKRNWFKESISFKLIIISCLTLLLLIPSALVKNLINEREYRKEEVIEEITSKIGRDQTIEGPYIILPFKKKVYYEKSTNIVTDYFMLSPSQLTIDGKMDPEKKNRSIYDVLVYQSQLNITGSISKEDMLEWPGKYSEILWDEARLVFGISDLRGVSKTINFTWNGEKIKMQPGVQNSKTIHTGVNAPINLINEGDNHFSIELELAGSESFSFVPSANTTDVHLSSTWKTPSFIGEFSPTSNIDEEGFEAHWHIVEMNKSMPQKWLKRDSYPNTYQSSGVQLINAVDTYQKSTRSVKYALLFISLTFITLFFTEVTKKQKVHPIQYFMIGIALVIFYSLLISLAEHLSFNLAYFIASAATIILVASYVQSILRRARYTFIIALMLSLLYAFLFTILQIADYALLLGNIGIFVILAMVMFFSRKVNWYGKQEDD